MLHAVRDNGADIAAWHKRSAGVQSSVTTSMPSARSRVDAVRRSQEQQTGFAVLEGCRNPLGNEPIAGGQKLRRLGRRRRRRRLVAGAVLHPAAVQLILADQQLRIFRSHQNGPLAHQFQDELMVEAAGPGKLVDDLLFLAATGNPSW